MQSFLKKIKSVEDVQKVKRLIEDYKKNESPKS